MVIKKFDVIGIYGESGSGKSTLINILTCLLRKNKGEIIIDGNKLDEFNIIRKYQNLFSIASQDTFLIDGTLKDNITFGSDENYSETKMKEAVDFARLNKFVNNLEYGLDTYVGSTIKQLSSGQKQRIVIARAFYDSREILVLDEATNAIDEETEKNIFKNIIDEKGDKTIVIVSHNKSNLSFCDNRYEIKDGKILKL